jgi:hypothetical protein
VRTCSNIRLPATAKDEMVDNANAAPPLVVPIPRRRYRPSVHQEQLPWRQGDLQPGRETMSNRSEALRSQDPRGPLAWNFKAYAEFRTNQFTAAQTSIFYEA